MMTRELWQDWLDGGDGAARDELIRTHLRLVHHVAGQLIRSGSARGLELDDLVSAGTIGLMNAIDTFDRDRGLAFSTHAIPRIRGAILDDLRRQDPAPRSVRRKQRELAHAREELAGALSRAPTGSEVAQRLGVGPDQLRRWEMDAESGVPLSLDSGTPGEARRAAAIPGTGEAVDEVVARADELRVLTRSIQGLRHPDRLVITLYYHEGLRMHQIAEVLGVTESRVSQIRSRALKQLRAELAFLRD